MSVSTDVRLLRSKQLKGGWAACRLSQTQPHRVPQAASGRICHAFPAPPTRLLNRHPPRRARRPSLRFLWVRPNRPAPPAAMGSHRAAVWLATAAAAIVVVASVPAAWAVPAAAAGAAIDANSMTVGAGAVARTAMSFLDACSGDGAARWTATRMPEVARVGDLEGGGRYGSTLHGVVHWSATEAASLPGTRLTGASEAIANITASSLFEWNVRVVALLRAARVGGVPLPDQYHIIVIKDSILQKAVKSFVGTVYATKWRVNGTIMVIFIFRSGILRHQARPLFEDLGIYANGRTKTDRSNSPLVVVTFSPP
ncbi:hypothetical protein BU14_0413s0004 [Porphyra umbilicalis]|uniref:Uncharacterized protein n=1 Tax=Porphyra umbilicalis TaxID=2786 RepID=A0A1X6NW12_PORUM|nr:hypothetical protein BU14_0413s0004 [Porphyra umbilicalis]|eukprot:OSX72696.1 hypothetical protein BU14_0413s0004 [Porphyra umbilicalis]